MNPKLLLRYLKKLPGKWFIPIIVFIWILAIGFRVISRRTSSILTIIVILIWLIYLLIRWLRTRGIDKEAEKASRLVKGFEERLIRAIELKRTKDSPWYLVIGPASCGKTTLLANLNLDLQYIDALQEKPITKGIGKTVNCDLFLTREAVVLDTAGRYVTDGNDSNIKTEFSGLLSLVKKYRRERPIEGLIVVVNVAELLQGGKSAIEEQATMLRDRIEDIVSNLGITFPVYLLFTKSDLIYGFPEFFNNLDDSGRAQVWGATLRQDQQENLEDIFKEECDKLYQTLIEKQMIRLGDRPEGRNAVYAFPLEFNQSYQKMVSFVSTLFPSRSKERPLFRGFYFTSGTHGEGSPVEFVLQKVAGASASPEPSAASSGDTKGYFIKDLFHKVIFPDRGLYKPTTAAERRRRLVRLILCASAVTILAALAIIYSLSYVKSKNLMVETERQSVSVSEINMATDPVEKIERYEELRKPIVRLEKSSIFSLPWQKERDNVADAARRLYLIERYGSGEQWQVDLTRNVSIPVKVLKSEGEKVEYIPDVELKAVSGGKEYILTTDEEGTANLDLDVEDGKVEVVFSTEYEIEGYEPQRDQIYEIQPGEKKSAKGVAFVFSKLGRSITVDCVDQFGDKLGGVPISVEKTGEAPSYKQQTNEQGIAEVRVDAPEGSMLMVYYGDSPTNYGGESDTIVIESGKSKYFVKKQLRRKIKILVTAFAGSVPKPGVSVSIDNKTLGVTEASGQLNGVSDTIPTDDNIQARPAPRSKKLEQTESGYSVVLEYAEPVVEAPKPPKPKPRLLKFVSDSGKSIPDMEVWVFLKEGENPTFRTLDEMEFKSEGNKYRIVQVETDTDNSGNLTIPKEAEGHQLLLYNPDYWPMKVDWSETSRPVEMTSIKEEKSYDEFDQIRKDGAEYYYGIAQVFHNQKDYEEAIKNYQYSIRLVPRLKHYLRLGWAYYRNEDFNSARKVTAVGSELELLDDLEADKFHKPGELTLKQQLSELLNLIPQ
jgi:hypothetical protein